MDMIQKMLDQLEIDHIFLHADKAIHSKVLIIQGKYDQIITFLGGFHTIMVILKILGKKYSCLGLKEWWIEADVIAQGSADQAMEGRHYHRSIRLHKQAFEALLRYRMKGVLNKGVFTPGFKRQIVNLRLVQSTANLKSITNSPEFKQMINNLTDVFGTQAQMMMQYIRDVSAMLCFVSAVRENTIETTINREVKVRGGPMQGGFSTDEKAVDTFVKTSHFMATVRAKLKERLDVLTQSVHKETTIGAIKKHEAMIEGLVLQLDKYFDPFLDGPARHFKTGAEIEPSVIEGLLNSSAVGEAMYAEFIDERLKAKENRVSIFASIKNPRIKTGMERAKKIPKAISILKEDRQAFGSLVGKATSPRDAHSYPLTTVPLALASPDSDLRQGCKAALRNFLIEESLAEVQTPLSKAAWLVDGMAAVRSIKSKPT